jgi:hypothetical protein
MIFSCQSSNPIPRYLQTPFSSIYSLPKALKKSQSKIKVALSHEVTKPPPDDEEVAGFLEKNGKRKYYVLKPTMVACFQNESVRPDLLCLLGPHLHQKFRANQMEGSISLIGASLTHLPGGFTLSITSSTGKLHQLKTGSVPLQTINVISLTFDQVSEAELWAKALRHAIDTGTKHVKTPELVVIDHF